MAKKAKAPAGAAKGALSSKESLENKLISIRIPKSTIQKLRDLAEARGNIGYQQLIKSFITEAISEERNGNGAKPPAPANKRDDLVFSTKDAREQIRKTLEECGGAGRRRKSPRHETPIIKEDIQKMVGYLEPYYDQFEGSTFLITGAFGFLGRYLVMVLKYLNDHVLKKKVRGLLLDNFVTGYEQQVISDRNLTFIKHNVIDPFKTDAQVDYLIHAAGIASPVYYTKFPIETMDVGTIGTRNMLELAYQKGVKSFLFTSSSEVYGDPDSQHVPTTEEYFGNVSITGPRSCYDESKRFGETMCLAFWRVYNVPVKIVRPFNVYGPGIRPDDFRVLPNFIEHALRHEPLPVHGRGVNTRSFCYINDAIESIFRVLFTGESGEPYNIGNPEHELSVQELGELVAECMPYKVEVLNIDPPHAVYSKSDPKRRCPDISKVQTATGFQPRYSLEEGLTRTIKWFCQV